MTTNIRFSLHRFALAGAALLAGCLVLPGLARAQVSVYTTQASFNAASIGSNTYTFSGAPAGSYTIVTPSYTDGPLTFAAASLYLFNDNAFGTGVNYLGATGNSESITLSGATALSFTLGTYYAAQTIAISVNGAPATTVTETGGHPNTMFVGFTDSVPITSLTFTSAAPEIDVIQFQAPAVPEPSTWAAVALGAGLLGVVNRRRRAA